MAGTRKETLLAANLCAFALISACAATPTEPLDQPKNELATVPSRNSALAQREDGWPPPIAADAPTDRFSRVVFRRTSASDPGRYTLQASVRELRHPESGASVILFGMVHIGDAAYYRSLETRLAESDLVLAETTTEDPGAPLPATADLSELGRWFRRQRKVMQNLLGLTSQEQWQPGVVDSRWRSADMPREEMFARAEKIPVPPQLHESVLRLEKLARGTEQDVATAREEVARDVLASASSLDRKPGELSEFHAAREAIMFVNLKAAVASGEHRRIALVLGAAHQHALEPRIEKQLGYRVFATSWHDVFTYEYSGTPAAPK